MTSDSSASLSVLSEQQVRQVRAGYLSGVRDGQHTHSVAVGQARVADAIALAGDLPVVVAIGADEIREELRVAPVGLGATHPRTP